MQRSGLIGVLNPIRSRSEIPEELFLPTYQNRLRVIGRHLDVGEYRNAVILEVEGGFLARAFSPREHTPELLEFPTDSFDGLIQEAVRSRGRAKKVRRKSKLLPTGYEDFLRALGYELDRRQAKSIVITECDDQIFVAGLERVGGPHGGFASFNEGLTSEHIDVMLDMAFRRRRR